MHYRKSVALLVGALALLLVGVGCGGSSGGETTASISKSEFVEQANVVCERGREKLHSDFLVFSKEKNDNPNPSSAEYAEYVTRIIAPDMKQEIIAKIRNLGSPKGDEESVDAMLAAVEEGVRKAEEDPRSALINNGQTFAKAIGLATAYGLKACAETY